jgi:hypothetical protein
MVQRSQPPAHARRSRPQMVPCPGHRPVVTPPLLTPGRADTLSGSLTPPPGHVPIPTANPSLSPMRHCSDWGARLMRAFMAQSSKSGAGPAWLVGTPQHLYSKRHAGSRAAGFIAGWGCGCQKVVVKCGGISKKYLQHSDIQYVSLCAGISLCAGMCRYVRYIESTTVEIPAHAIHAFSDILAHTRNTCSCLQYMHIVAYMQYMQYMHIHAIHTHDEILAHTCNTNTYLHMHAHTGLYRYIPAIHAHTCNGSTCEKT